MTERREIGPHTFLAELVAWAQLIGFTHAPELARCEINASATGSCTSRPASPAVPANYACASTLPGAGPQ